LQKIIEIRSSLLKLLKIKLVTFLDTLYLGTFWVFSFSN